MLRKAAVSAYSKIDKACIFIDKRSVRRTRNLRLIPERAERWGGKTAYGEWCHVVGIFQTLIGLNLPRTEQPRILDVGCGTGLLAIASEPFVAQDGAYVGIDVDAKAISVCQRTYPAERFSFVHVPAKNVHYAPHQDAEHVAWPLRDADFDFATALSVWTHLNEDDAIYYFRELARVMKPGAKALVTAFVLDEVYEASLARRRDVTSPFHCDSQQYWTFEVPCSPSGHWRRPRWAEHPEQAVGFTVDGLRLMLAGTNLEWEQTHHGGWKERPGVYFQDVLVFRKG